MTLCFEADLVEAKYKHMQAKMAFEFFLLVALAENVPSGARRTDRGLFGGGQ